METLTLISGIASLIGLVLQFKDAFPEHRETRKTVVVLLLGVFFGCIITSLFSLKSSLPAEISPLTISIGVFLVIICLLVTVACFATDSSKRNDLFTVACLAGVVVLILLFFESQKNRPVQECDLKHFLYEDEIFKLADDQASKGNYERAIVFLQQTLPSVSIKDPRTAIIMKRIQELRARQLNRK